MLLLSQVTCYQSLFDITKVHLELLPKLHSWEGTLSRARFFHPFLLKFSSGYFLDLPWSVFKTWWGFFLKKHKVFRYRAHTPIGFSKKTQSLPVQDAHNLLIQHHWIGPVFKSGAAGVCGPPDLFYDIFLYCSEGPKWANMIFSNDPRMAARCPNNVS